LCRCKRTNPYYDLARRNRKRHRPRVRALLRGRDGRDLPLGRAGMRLGKNHGPSTTGSDGLIEVAHLAPMARPQTRTLLPEHAMPESCQPPLAHVFAPELANVEPLQSIRPRFLGHERELLSGGLRAMLAAANAVARGTRSPTRRQRSLRSTATGFIPAGARPRRRAPCSDLAHAAAASPFD
jgi:hypothetical protein